MSKTISSQTTIVTANVAYALGTATVNEPILVKALPTNSGIVYLGNNGSDTVSSTNGFPLSAGDVATIETGSLASIYVTSTASGDKVAILYGSV